VPKKDKVSEKFRVLNNEEIRVHSSLSIITVMKHMGLRWAGYLARVRETRILYRTLMQGKLYTIKLDSRSSSSSSSNVKYKMLHHISNHWGHWNCN
jgi:hypothetical protein